MIQEVRSASMVLELWKLTSTQLVNLKKIYFIISKLKIKTGKFAFKLFLQFNIPLDWSKAYWNQGRTQEFFFSFSFFSGGGRATVWAWKPPGNHRFTDPRGGEVQPSCTLPLYASDRDIYKDLLDFYSWVNKTFSLSQFFILNILNILMWPHTEPLMSTLDR